MSNYVAHCPKCGSYRKRAGKCWKSDCPVPRSAGMSLLIWIFFGFVCLLLILSGEESSSSPSTETTSEVHSEEIVVPRSVRAKATPEQTLEPQDAPALERKTPTEETDSSFTNGSEAFENSEDVTEPIQNI